MTRRRSTRRAGAALAALTTAAGLSLAAPSVGAPASYTTRLVPQASCSVPQAGHARCFAIKLTKIKVKTGSKQAAQGVASPSATATPGLAAGPAGGYTPADLAIAYGVTANSSVGAKQTVAIVDAYDEDPAIVRSDLNAFDTQNGLAQETSTSLRVVEQDGTTDFSGKTHNPGWALEISLDVQAVRGVCNKCKIILVEANDSSFANLGAAENEAAALGATEISNSYGGPEAGPPGAFVTAAYKHRGVVITASTGDDGWYGWDFFNNVNSPNTSQGAASYPSTLNTVVAVGGTTLQLNDNATRASEAVWNDNGPADIYGFSLGGFGATGGGCSTHVDTTLWQRSVAGYSGLGCANDATTKVGFRSAADIAAVADPFTGFDVLHSFDNKNGKCPTTLLDCWQTIGGTSLAAPLVAALWALAGGSGGLDNPSLALYGHFKSASSTLFDVSFGGNGACDFASPANCAGAFGGNPNDAGAGLLDCAFPVTGAGILPNRHQCYAAIGFDGPSGVGSPKGTAPFTPMNPAATFTHSPATVTHGITQTFTSTSTDPYPGGTYKKYVWNWGDGSTTTLFTSSSAAHKYTTTGTRTVTLTVFDSYGRSGSKSATITVH